MVKDVPGSIAFRPDAAEPLRVLGMPPTASASDVRRAFRTLVRDLHPDTNPAAQPGAKLSSIVAAYDRLERLGVLERPDASSLHSSDAPTLTSGRYVDVYA
jgi:curved DNA-binding protein CbpA